ncbi:MAG: SRPBCC domain-containing protein [Myxococcales bacterium]|nr:MAG: SRPBCC domain-containing protein [Myxococcales bacterium]
MAKANESDAEHLRIERTLPAPRELVYRAFTEPSRMLRWFGPHGFEATTIDLDLQEGGAWRGGMRGSDGKELIASGVYRQIVPSELLVFTYAWEEEGVRGHETLCRVELHEHGGQTRLVFTQGPFESAEATRSHAGGWGEALEKLESEVRK